MDSELAINGGSKTVTFDETQLVWPILPEKAKKMVLHLLDKQPAEISTGPTTDEFANKFGDYIGVDFSIPLCNGTAGLYSAYACLDLKPGDEVICPSYTYWATAMPAVTFGVKIVFAEIDPISLCIDPEDIKKKVTPKTKAIVPVHIWGMPADMDPICEIAKSKDIAVIEDASHAHGASYKGKKVGGIGDIGVFSFQGTKLMPAGEAGVFLTNNEEFYEKALAIGHYERVKTPFVAYDSPYLKYATTTSMGMKFRMSPLHAAIGLAYLETLDVDNELRNSYCEKFRRIVRALPGFDAFETPKHIKRVFYEHHIQYDESIRKISNKQMAETLQAEGVSLSVQRYRLIHQQPYFQELGYPKNLLPITDEAVGKQFKVPNFSVKSEELLNQYIMAFEKVSKLIK